jgi:mitochondrial protein import protein ZIM17
MIRTLRFASKKILPALPPKHAHRAFCECLSGIQPGLSSPSPSEGNDPNFFQDVPGVKASGEKYAMVYTCNVCNTRSVKKISKQSYHQGCVVVKCPGCANMHLIADHLGVFEDKGWTIDKFLAEHGEKVKVVTEDNVMELTSKDLTGSNLNITHKED